MGGDDRNGFEAVAANSVFGFGFGTVLGGCKAIWAQAPTANAKVLPMQYSEIANMVGKTSMNYAILAGIYTAGATVASGVRCTNDSLNYGVGGACVGAFIGLRAKSLHRVVVNAVVLGAVGTACAYSTNLLNNPSMDQRKKFYERYSYLPQEDSKA